LEALAADLSVERLARGTRDNLLGIVLERLFGTALFLSLPFLLAPRALGTYYEVVALLTLAVGVATIGVDLGVVRFTALAAERGAFDEVGRYVWTGLRITAISSFSMAAGLWVAAPGLAHLFRASEFQGAIRVGAAAVPLLVGAYVLLGPSKGLKLMWPTVATMQIAQPAVQCGASVGLVLAGYGVAGAAAGFTGAAAVTCLVALILMIRLRLPRGVPSRPPVTRPLLRFSAPVSGMVLMGTALLWLDTLLLGVFRPATEVATYGVVVRFLSLSTALALTVIQIFGPFVTQFVARHERHQLSDALRTATRWTAGLTAPLLVALIILGRPLLALFRQTAPAGVLVAIVVLAAGFLADATTLPTAHVLTMSGRPAVNLANSASAVAVNLSLNLILIPRLGLLGAAVSWSVVLIGLAAARLIEAWRLVGVVPFGRALWKPFAAAALASAAALLVRSLAGARGVASLSRLGFTGLALLAMYTMAMWWFGLEPEDRTLFRALTGRRRPAPSA
jgi:O-antigen/teichoic acid export membrane protein